MRFSDYQILYFEGFDSLNDPSPELIQGREYGTDYSPVYVSSSGWNSRENVYGTNLKMAWCWSSKWYLSPYLPNGQYERLGVHFLLGIDSLTASDLRILRFYDEVSNNTQVDIVLTPSGGVYDLRALRGTSQIGNSVAGFYTPGSANWAFLSVFLEVSATSGRLAVRGGMNDAILIDYQGNTQNTARAAVDRVQVGAINLSATGALDDLIVYTAPAGSEPMKRIRIVDNISPQADVQAQWQRTGGSSNAAAVSTSSPGSNPGITASLSGSEDRYSLMLPSFNGALAGVAHCARLRKVDPGPARSVKILGGFGQAATESAAFPVFANAAGRKYWDLYLGHPTENRDWQTADLTSDWRIGLRLE